MAGPVTTSSNAACPGQDTSSTTYKARLVGDFILERLQRHRETTIGDAAVEPLMVAMHGPQGCGELGCRVYASLDRLPR